MEFVCLYCGKLFDTLKCSFTRHEKTCSLNPNRIHYTRVVKQGDLSGTCLYCGKLCKNQNSVRNHERLCEKNPNCLQMSWLRNLENGNDLPFTCLICGKAVSTINCLSNHMVIHDDSKKNLLRQKCKYCGKLLGNTGALRLHENCCEYNSDRKTVVCRYCGCLFNGSIGSHERSCEDNPNRNPLCHSPETKLFLRDKRLLVLNDNPELQLLWRYKKSYVCELFKNWLSNNGFVFEEEYRDNTWDRFFSLDIAFVLEKVDIEINGSMHYDKDGQLKPYYKDRHLYLVGQGWTVIEIEAGKSKTTGFRNKFLHELLKILEV